MQTGLPLNTTTLALPTAAELITPCITGNKFFELSNHLGNVLVTISDRKVPITSTVNTTQIAYFEAAIETANDYYPFGMTMPSRSYSAQSVYRYGFNGQEKSDEIFEGSTTALFWEYDTRTGRRWNIDPKLNIWERPYLTFGGNPIRFNDVFGDTWGDKNGKELNKEKLKKVKVYIFYDPKKSGKDGGFSEQTMKQFDIYEKMYGIGTVALSASTDTKTFKKDWGNITGNPEIVAINMHGSNQAIHINSNKKEYLSSNETGKTNSGSSTALEIKNLPMLKADISKTILQLNTCNSNDHFGFKHGFKGSHLTVAESFRKYFNFDGVRSSGAFGVSYYSNGMPRSQDGFWTHLYRDYFKKRDKPLIGAD